MLILFLQLKKKRSKGRKPRQKGQKLGMQDTGGWRLGSWFPPPTVPRHVTIIHRSEVVSGGYLPRPRSGEVNSHH